MSDAVLTFQNTHGAIYCERILMENDFSVKVMALPDELSSDCGLCIRLDADKLDSALEILAESSVTHTGIYRYEEKEGRVSYTPW